MAIINFNIEADGVEDFHTTLRKLLAGDGAKTLVIDHISKAVEQKPVAPIIVTVDDTEALTGDTQREVAPETADNEDAILDAHGHPWSADLHASTKALTKEGIWRMRPGAVRPAPMPGYPKEVAEANPTSAPTGSVDAVQGTDQSSEVIDTQASLEPAGIGDVVTNTVSPSEDSEAEMWMDAAGDIIAEATAIPPREWTDADLSKLCNQAAKALEPKGAVPALKELVAVYSASGTVPHSRNIPVEDRERFAGEVEALANITYEG